MQHLPFSPNSDNPYDPIPVQPVRSSMPEPDIAGDREAAADLIRKKLAAIYGEEPSAGEKIKEVQKANGRLSKHQIFMQGLQASGRSLAEIQHAWHEYYMGLPDEEKHEVWHEFYAAGSSVAQPSAPYPQATAPATATPQPYSAHTAAPAQPQPYFMPAATPIENPATPLPDTAKGTVIPADFSPAEPGKKPDPHHSQQARPSVTDIKQKIRDSVSAKGKLTAKHHLQSLGFGLAMGTIVIFVVMFGFFNEVFLTPFIQPPRQASETPVIVNTAAAPASDTPEVIIPKINVEIPVDYSQTSTSEAAIETALNDGVVHYPTTVMPGQTGNTAFFGHSSNNIFNPGKYKFAFVLLHKLTEGDTFYLTYQGKTYAYEVISHQVVPPTDIAVLGPVPGQTATATLITCDPPGTSINRLVVVGKQVSPDPSGNTAPSTPSAPTPADSTPSTKLPGNGPTLWSRMWHAIF